MRRLCLVGILPIACFDFGGNVRRSEKFQEVCKFTKRNLKILKKSKKFRKNRQGWPGGQLVGEEDFAWLQSFQLLVGSADQC